MARFSRFRRKSRFRRFRRNRSTWFPTLGTIFADEENQFHDASFSNTTFNVAVSRGFGPQGNPLDVFAITRDFTPIPAPSDTQLSLRDNVEGQTWHLDRIVGSLVCASGQGDTTELQPDPTLAWQNIQVTAGFFLARQIEDNPGFPDLDIGEYDPAQASNIQNPWIWRKSWILANPLARSNVAFWPGSIPTNNIFYPADRGCGIDSKVKRKIPREYRLWFAIGAMGWNGNQVNLSIAADPDVQPVLRYHLDIRVLGRMQRARNTGQF